MLNSIPGVDPARRDRLVEVLDIDPSWRMHLVSGGCCRGPSDRGGSGWRGIWGFGGPVSHEFSSRSEHEGWWFAQCLPACPCASQPCRLHATALRCTPSTSRPRRAGTMPRSSIHTVWPSLPALACRWPTAASPDRHGAAQALPGGESACTRGMPGRGQLYTGCRASCGPQPGASEAAPRVSPAISCARAAACPDCWHLLLLLAGLTHRPPCRPCSACALPYCAGAAAG